MAKKRGVGGTGLPSKESYTGRMVGKQGKAVAKLKRKSGDEKYDAKRPPVAGRVDPEVRDKLEAIAETLDTSLSSVVEQALVYFCEEYDAGNVELEVEQKEIIQETVQFSRNMS